MRSGGMCATRGGAGARRQRTVRIYPGPQDAPFSRHDALRALSSLVATTPLRS